ncbi:MAG: peptidoglycan DD-metalloendopeptidase family protein [Paludibacteraceae bacterium]|nr:peptidoglycan DD-metalloendopeptidase family protein [Paludibacteraceae bacterium]
MYNEESWFRRIRRKRRLTLIDDDTLREFWHIHVSGLGVFTALFFMFLLTIGVLSLLIIYTPFRNILPGYSASLRQEIIEESMRVDSLQQTLDLQTQYIGVIRDVVAGEVKSDTVIGLDSMQLVMQAQLLEAKNEATAAFMAEYEERERDNLLLFDAPTNEPVFSLYAPAHGVIIAPYAPQEGRHGVVIRTPDKENVCSTLDGMVVHIDTEDSDTHTVMVLHHNYLSIYRSVGRVTCRVGEAVQTGQTIAIVKDGTPIVFELWKQGLEINPAEVIAF